MAVRVSATGASGVGTDKVTLHNVPRDRGGWFVEALQPHPCSAVAGGDDVAADGIVDRAVGPYARAVRQRIGPRRVGAEVVALDEVVRWKSARAAAATK